MSDGARQRVSNVPSAVEAARHKEEAAELGQLRAEVERLGYQLDLAHRRSRRAYALRRFGERVVRVSRRLVRERRLRDRP